MKKVLLFLCWCTKNNTAHRVERCCKGFW